MLKVEAVLNHSDEVSGTYVLDDGTRCYWTEGRSSEIVCVRPNGEEIYLPASGIEDLQDEEPELVACLAKMMYEGADCEYRVMTPEEEAEHAAARC